MRRSTYAEAFWIGEYMKDKIDVLENGLCRYKDGWSDAKIYVDMRNIYPESSIRESSISTVRMQIYGRLDKQVSRNDLMVKIEELASRIALLEIEIAEIKKAP